MSPQTWVRLLWPSLLAFAISKTGWIYAVMFQRDRPISAFQKTVTRYVSLFVLGMGYIVLWQYELDAAFHLRSAGQVCWCFGRLRWHGWPFVPYVETLRPPKKAKGFSRHQQLKILKPIAGKCGNLNRNPTSD